MSQAKLFSQNNEVQNYSNVSDLLCDEQTLEFISKERPDDMSRPRVAINLPFIAEIASDE
jgi:hypothetical protein